jgi:hypothetical protein
MRSEIIPIREGNGGVISYMNLDLSLDDVLTKLGGMQTRPAVVEAVSESLSVAQLLWRPQIVYRWVDVLPIVDGTIQLRCDQTTQSVNLTMGFSSKFMKEASRALIGVYTVGKALEDEAVEASRGGRMLDGYLYDIFGLAILDQLKCSVDRVAEDYSKKHGWGVSPFLSPGSVHGWELEDQGNLCLMVPIDMIDATLQESKVLQPFKSISFLIGTGPGYQVTEVGTTCEVCSKRDNCEMRKEK